LHGKALPHHCIHATKTPLLQFTGDLPCNGSPGSSCRDSVVIWSFLKGLS
jgi:hypothetical protein